MKILSFLNIYNNQNKTMPMTNPVKNNNSSAINYAYNLNCDTVSFGISHATEINEVFMNTEAIYQDIKGDSPDDALKFIEELSAGEWNPLYAIKDKEEYGGTTSLMSLVISKITNPECRPEDWNNLADIAGEIIAHPDFVPVDNDLEEDYFAEAISEGSPEIAMMILKSGKMDEHLNKNLVKYYQTLAQNVGMNGIAEEMTKVLENTNWPKIIKNQQQVSEALDEMLEDAQPKGKGVTQLDRINSKLNPYKVFASENDPKSFAEVGGMFQAKKDIDEFILKPWNKDFRDKIVENKLNRPSGFLLSGPPGCGKTYILKALSAETGYDLYEINLANIGASTGYSTQNNLKSVFDNLEEKYKLTGEPSILLLDELDSIARDRQKCHTDWKKDDINALLMVLNNSAQRGIIVVGATNNPDDLDEAVIRPGRLDKHLVVEKPNEEERKDIVEKILSNRPVGQDLLMESDVLAKKLRGKTPAEISSVLHNACLNAIYSYHTLATMDDFDKMLASQNSSKIDKGRTRISGFGV